jgi:hypothetical protein
LLSDLPNARPSRLRSSLFKIVVLVVAVVPLAAIPLAIRLLWQRAVHPLDLALLAVMYALVAFGGHCGLPSDADPSQRQATFCRQRCLAHPGFNGR